MKLYKNSNGAIYAYSDEDLENLAKQGINPIEKLSLTYFEYTPEEIEAKQIERDKQLLISQAKALLRSSDYRLIPDEYAELTTEQQTELVAYRAQLRLVARGESAELPTISF